MSSDSATLKVPKEKVEVLVHLEGGVKLDGLIFLEEKSYDQTVYQKVISFIEDENLFFPLIQDNGARVEFINKSNIMVLECVSCDEQPADDIYIGIMHIEKITVLFADGAMISGALMAEVPEDKARLSDCLNLKGEFLKLKMDERFFFVNKSRVQKVLYSDRP